MQILKVLERELKRQKRNRKKEQQIENGRRNRNLLRTNLIAKLNVTQNYVKHSYEVHEIRKLSIVNLLQFKKTKKKTKSNDSEVTVKISTVFWQFERSLTNDQQAEQIEISIRDDIIC